MRVEVIITLACGLALFLILMNSGGAFQDFVQHDPVLGQIGGLPYVTFFSTKSPSMYRYLATPFALRQATRRRSNF